MITPVFVVLGASLLVCTEASASFRNLIPNGGNVANPCNPSATWVAVGHQTPSAASGGLNSFGNDFNSAGKRWTTALCQRDSDGDGRTNGDELGDPNCVWRIGATPSRTTNISHPGICEPITSQTCMSRNGFLTTATCQVLAQARDLNCGGGNCASIVSSAFPYYTGFRPTVTPRVPQWQVKRGCVCYCMETPSVQNVTNYIQQNYQPGQRNVNIQQIIQRFQQENPVAWQQLSQQYQQQPNGWQLLVQMFQQRHQQEQQRQLEGQQGGQFNSNMVMDSMMPPILQTPEFNNTAMYSIERRCTCACPKTTTGV